MNRSSSVGVGNYSRESYKEQTGRKNQKEQKQETIGMLCCTHFWENSDNTSYLLLHTKFYLVAFKKAVFYLLQECVFGAGPAGKAHPHPMQP